MTLTPAFAKKLLAAVVMAILALIFLMAPIDAIRIHDEFLRLMISIAVGILIIYIFYTYRKALKETSLKSIRETVKRFEPDVIFPDEPGFKEHNPDN